VNERLYYNDSYTVEFRAEVVEHTAFKGMPAVILDRTYFYPEGGGQPADSGQLEGIQIVDVQIRGDDHAVVHVLEHDLKADIVTGQVDWDRRFDHMQHHTGQHILTQAFVELQQVNTIGFHLSERTVTIDLDIADISPEMVQRVEALVNDVITENRPVTAKLYDPDELPENIRMRKMPDYIATDGLRVVEIENFDRTACGGTHVAFTGEIGLLKITSAQKYKQGSRIEFVCGRRALLDYADKHDILTSVSNMLSAGLEDVPQLLEGLQAEFKATSKQLQAARKRLAGYVASELIDAAETRDGVRIVSLVSEEYDLRELALKLRGYERTIVLLASPGEKAQVIAARSDDVDYNMNVLINEVFGELGSGRGGGRPEMAQGGATDVDQERLHNALTAALNKFPD